MVVFDTNMLLMLVRPDVMVAKDAQGNQISHAKDRVDGLVQQLGKDKIKIVIPTPVLSEVLVRSTPGDRSAMVEHFRRSAAFRIEPFDERAAVELADMEKRAIDGGDKRGGVQGPWAKVKFDRQIVAIAQVAGVKVIYTDDGNLAKLAYARSLRTVGIGNLQIPMAAAQIPLPYDVPRRKINLSDDDDQLES
ncbi:PIN domain-containing protein [Rhizobium sp. WYCCWR 11128]|uniref:type II toxin-antitoxin system VapC family toxin n=1 Tax=Rhizobium sp. WYCCWR 11128 TaxID=2749832 RepID=UPI0015D3A118|nr:PIN domain-containing protein [Rhizobium sp. WYCCWR 11128]NYT34522.1 PIN domain-containing protein [Rhizobium sp. WYCCWR 11128]